MSRSRTIATYYEDELGAEHDITVEVRADGLRDVLIETELPDMSESEESGLRERAAELYWAAESAEYERGQCALEDRGYAE